MTELATQELARARAARIRAGIQTYLHTLADIAAAYAQRDWVALGYADWSAYVDGEYSEHRLKLSAEHRQKAVQELRLAGMSTRAIGSTLGISHTEVGRQLRSGGTDVPPVAEIQGADGKTYAAARPQTPAADEQGTAPSAYPHDHPVRTGEADARLDAAVAAAASEDPTGTPDPVGAGDRLADAMAQAIDQAMERAAQQKADRDALCAPREVVDAVNAATHFVPAMVRIQSACEDLLHHVRDVDPEQAVTDLPEQWRDRLDVARDAHAYLTRVVDALDRIGVPA